jgi:hypothetical protein
MTEKTAQQPTLTLAPEDMRDDLYDESNGLWYTKVGDYYLPNLVSGDTNYDLGRWAHVRLRYIKEHKRTLYRQLRVQGKLNTHLHNTEQSCLHRLELLQRQMGEREGLTEELKAQDQMAWVRLANSIRHRAEEIVYSDLIYV